MRTALLILIGLVILGTLMLEALVLVRSIRCRAWADPQGGQNVACRAVPW